VAIVPPIVVVDVERRQTSPKTAGDLGGQARDPAVPGIPAGGEPVEIVLVLESKKVLGGYEAGVTTRLVFDGEPKAKPRRAGKQPPQTVCKEPPPGFGLCG